MAEKSGDDRMTKQKNTEKNSWKKCADQAPRVAERTVELSKANEQLKREIEERKAIENALRESEERYRLLFDNAGASLQVFDHDGILLMMNETAAGYYGGIPSDFIGKSFHELGLEAADKHLERVRAIFMDGGKSVHEQLIKTPLGKEAWFLANAHPIRNAKGDIFAVQFISQDITERKKAENILRESEEEYRYLFDSIPDPVVIVQEGPRVLYNKAFTKVFGYTQNDIAKGLKPFDIFEDDDAKKIAHERLRKRLAGEEVTPEFDYVNFVKKGGGIVHCEATGRLIQFKGQPADLVVLRNVTERKKAEERIHSLTHQLITYQEKERRMISLELHDRVAQDLSACRIACEMLLTGGMEDPSVVSQKISELSETLRATIMAIRDLSYDLRPPGLDELGLVQVLYQYCKDFSEKTGLKVDFKPAGFNKLRIDSDTEINLYRLVQEGLNNINKHAEAEHVFIKLVSSFPNIILRIEDDGKGFNVQERMSMSAEEKRMGLQSMEERVGLLQGKISIRSRTTKGTKIQVVIPFGK